ncbi:hypothetical protein P7K49_003463 [Saguinus oedipus]|uniref:Uncharacterized protein n=1 Tax=Saguinus oedipus TaxID=9490 RepID=A0ABQ9W4K0_SAGOE|nr:hypothetical protein P7K49_003463 [Saguinus oedipus]
MEPEGLGHKGLHSKADGMWAFEPDIHLVLTAPYHVPARGKHNQMEPTLLAVGSK